MEYLSEFTGEGKKTIEDFVEEYNKFEQDAEDAENIPPPEEGKE